MFIRGDSWVERFVMIAGDSDSDGDSVDMASMDRRWDVSIMWRLVPRS